MKVRIEITKGPDCGRVFSIAGNEKIIIGRGDHVEVEMKDELISREHCELRCDGERLVLRDLGSTNHVFVHPNLREPIAAHQDYEIADQTCFFVGPESRFAVSFERSPQKTPAQTKTPSGHGNFTGSIDPKGREDFEGENSSFDILGNYAAAPGLDVRPPRQPAPTKVSPPLQSKDSRPPLPAGYDASSIAPPHLQGSDACERDQVGEELDVDESHLASTANVDGTAESPKSKPSTPVDDADHSSSFEASVSGESVPSHFESIASPGRIYPDRIPPPTAVESSNPFAASVMPEQPAVSGSIDSIEPPTQTPSNVQANGLYFHTGSDVKQISQLITELSEKLTPVFCLDLSRISPVGEIDKPSGNRMPAEPPAASESRPSEEVVTGPGSAFDLDDEDEPLQQPSETDLVQESPAITGIPLFDFLPENAQHRGPMLLTKDQLNVSIEDAWNQDALIVFFGADIEKMLAHLKQLVRINIQTGKTVEGMFGYCWPSILHSTLENQVTKSVARVFADSIACILLEDVQERFQWNLIAQRDFTQEAAILRAP